jgi:hypothetical protein
MVNNHEMSPQFGEWVIAKDHPPSIAYLVLSAFAAVVSYLIAHLFHLPEANWAPMSTLIVMKLTLSAALPICCGNGVAGARPHREPISACVD